MTEYVYSVDENDNVIGKITREQSKSNKFIHRGVGAFVFNKKGELFIHKRAKQKKLYPEQWDCTVGGGVDYGETYEEGLVREIEEEIGIRIKNPVFLFVFRYKDVVNNYTSKTYRCVVDAVLKFQEEEISEGRFETVENVKKLINEIVFCPDAIEVFEIFLKKEGKNEVNN